jgi:sodium-dependent dicarboxylate transporter 2/3/5
MTFGVPIVLIMLPIAWIMLTKVIFPSTQISIGDVGTVIKQELGELGSMSKAEKAVAYVFLGAALGWMFRQQVVALTGLSINDTTVALCAAMVLFAWPIVGKKTQFVLEWEDTKELPWGVLLLFGGGLALAAAFDHTGLSVWIGEAVTGFDVNVWLMIFIVAITVVFSTEITSNTASAATFLPVLGAVAIGMEMDPRMLTIPATVAASMAFMMPVATPPNAIVFTYDKMRLFDMVKAGFWLNIIAIAVTFASTYLLIERVFGI